MNRRKFLGLLGIGVTSGCLGLEQADSTPESGTGGPGAKTETPTGWGEKIDDVTAEEVQRLFVAADRALAAHTDVYAIAKDEETQIREIGNDTPATTISMSGTSLTLTDTDCYIGETDDTATTLARFDRETGQREVTAEIDPGLDLFRVIDSSLVCLGRSESDEYEERYENYVTVLDSDSLEHQWTASVGNSASPSGMCVIDGTLHVGFANFIVGYTMSDGTREYRAPEAISYPTAFDGDIIAEPSSELQRLDPATLDSVWSVGDDVGGVPVLYDDSVAAVTTNGLLSASIDTGEKQWSRTLDSNTSLNPEDLLYHNGVLWHGHNSETVYGIAPDTGDTVFTIGEDISAIASTNDGVVVTAGADLIEYQLVVDSDT